MFNRKLCNFSVFRKLEVPYLSTVSFEWSKKFSAANGFVVGDVGRMYMFLPEFFQIVLLHGSVRLRTHSRLFLFYINCVRNSYKFTNIGFKRTVFMRGVGFKFSMSDSGVLLIHVGFSHVLAFKLSVNTICANIVGEKCQVLELFSQDFFKINEIVYNLSTYRWPDSYKGLGIVLDNGSYSKLKEGKHRTI